MLKIIHSGFLRVGVAVCEGGSVKVFVYESPSVLKKKQVFDWFAEKSRHQRLAIVIISDQWSIETPRLLVDGCSGQFQYRVTPRSSCLSDEHDSKLLAGFQT